MAGNVAPNIVTDGLVLYLDAANVKSYVSGSILWNDLAGTNNGTLTNGPTFNSANGGSIVFDGVDDLATITPVNLNSISYTVESWVKRNTINILHGIISDLQFAWWVFGINDTNKLYLGHRRNDLVYNDCTGNANILTEWTHTVGVFDSNNGMRLYVNSNLDNFNSSTVLFTLGQGRGPQFIGQYRNSGPGNTNVMNGRISNLRIYNRALSATEILQNYNATKTRFGL